MWSSLWAAVPAPEVPLTATEVVQLPPARVLDESFTLVDDAGHGGRPGNWKAMRRRSKLIDLLSTLPAQMSLVIELFPFGRRQMRFELLPLLETGASRPALGLGSSPRSVTS